MAQYRITKYNPGLRAEDGAYLKNEWTSVSDIGNIYEDGLLTEQEYMRIEHHYIEAIRLILEETHSNYVKIVGLEKFEEEIEKPPKVQYTREDDEVYKMAKDGGILSNHQALVLSKLILREHTWCYLVNKEVILKFGYDYYLYTIVSKNLDCFDKIENELDLFVELLGS